MIVYNSLALSVFNNKFILSRKVSAFMLFRSMFTTRHMTKTMNINLIRQTKHLSMNGNNTQTYLSSVKESQHQKNMSHIKVYKYKKTGDQKLLKDVTNDTTGKHPHIMLEVVHLIRHQ